MFDRLKGMALILYNNTDFAQAAVRETKGWKIGGNKIKVKNENYSEVKCAFCICMYASLHVYIYYFNRWILQVKRVRLHSSELCRHLDKTLETCMKFLLSDGNFVIIQPLYCSVYK